MKCPNCGADNNDDSRFCSGCGTELKAAVTVSVENTEPQTKVEEKPGKAGEKAGKKKSGCLKYGLIALGALIVLFILLGSCGGDSGTATETTATADDSDSSSSSYPADLYLGIVGILPNAVNYIQNYPSLFTTDRDTAAQYTDFNKDPRAFFKSYNENNYGNALIRVKGPIYEAKEYAVDGGGTVTELLVFDGNEFYVVFVNQACNVYEGDYIEVLGLPVCMSSNDSDRLCIATAYLGKYEDFDAFVNSD